MLPIMITDNKSPQKLELKGLVSSLNPQDAESIQKCCAQMELLQTNNIFSKNTIQRHSKLPQASPSPQEPLEFLPIPIDPQLQAKHYRLLLNLMTQSSLPTCDAVQALFRKQSSIITTTHRIPTRLQVKIDDTETLITHTVTPMDQTYSA
mmetsp:Transcript_23497/g.30545  ORF Transcript_23497/g.30545 Transcript_23497/m.30545 type:complete len:150 (-) Transcript_23497:266-715(-)